MPRFRHGVVVIPGKSVEKRSEVTVPPVQHAHRPAETTNTVTGRRVDCRSDESGLPKVAIESAACSKFAAGLSFFAVGHDIRSAQQQPDTGRR